MESFDETLDIYGIGFFVIFVDGAGFSSQLDGLGDGCKGVCDCWNLDLSSSTVSAQPDPCSKTPDNGVAFEWFDVLEEWINAVIGSILGPMGPVFASIPGSLRSRAIVNSSSHKQEITHNKTSLLGRVNSVQDFPCGSGKFELK